MSKVSVSLSDIFLYIGNKNRPIKEGEEVFKAGHVILCQVDPKDNSIFGLVLQTSALNSPPHEVKLILNVETKDWSCVCTCKAGQSGYCKHVVATLIYTNRHAELEPLSCTNLKQAWGKEKVGLQLLYGAQKVTEFCHPKKRLKTDVDDTVTNTSEKNAQNMDMLLNSCKTSALGKFMKRGKSTKKESQPSKLESSSAQNLFQTPSQDYLAITLTGIANSLFLNQLNLSQPPLLSCCEQIVLMLRSDDIVKAANEFIQGSDAWRKLRQLRITGSRCYSIYTYALQNWSMKATKYFWPKSFTSKYTKYGADEEKNALKCYLEANPAYQVYTPGLIICQLYPWFGYSPDGIVFQNGQATKLLEIKCPYAGKTKGMQELFEMPYIEKNNENITLKEKHMYYGQVQLGMALLNLKKN